MDGTLNPKTDIDEVYVEELDVEVLEILGVASLLEDVVALEVEVLDI